jgi:hypothetical protein
MIKYILFIISIILLTSENTFSQSETDSIPLDRNVRSINLGNSISLGPEYIPFYPSQYGANLNYRFWFRTVNHMYNRTTDNTINISAGYSRLINENILRLKVGDLIRIKNKIHLGILMDYFIGSNTSLLALDYHIGIKGHLINRNCYFYIGGIQPIKNWGTEKKIKSNISIGFDFYIINRRSSSN